MSIFILRRALLLGTLSLAAAANAMPLYDLCGADEIDAYSYRGNNPAGPTATMGVFTSPFYRLPMKNGIMNGPTRVLLNYLRANYPAPYWSHDFGDQITEGDAWTIGKGHPYEYSDAIQGWNYRFGLNRLSIPFGKGTTKPDPIGPRPQSALVFQRRFIFMEREFSYYGSRTRISLSGAPFSTHSTYWEGGNPYNRYQFALNVGPTQETLRNYGALNKKFIGNLFVVDHYNNAPYGEGIVIRDGFEYYLCYKNGSYALTSSPSRPSDPEEYEGGVIPFHQPLP